MDAKYKELTDYAFKCHKNGDFKTASEIYNSLLEINPDDANILNLRGLLYIAEGNINAAVDYITKAFIINRSSGIANNLAKAYYNAGKPDKAVKLYLEALELSSLDNLEDTADIYYSLGLAYKSLGDMDASIAAYHKALEYKPEHYSACYNLSLAYSLAGKITNAVIYAEKCAAINQDDDTLFGVLSGYYEKLKEYNKAAEAIEKAAAIKQDNFIYCYNAAVLNSMINNSDKAVYFYLKAISLNPAHIESYVNLANIVKRQNTEKAAEFLTAAYKINPKEENLLLSLAQLYKDMRKNEESIKLLKELLLINPASGDAYSMTAMNYMDLCRYEQALAYYDSALKIRPEDVNFRHGRAVCLKYLGRIEECRQILEDIVYNNSGDDIPSETKITLGMLYLQNKEFEKGMKLYRLRADNIKSADINTGKIWNPYDEFENKNILVYSNCGLGDSIMYSRYLPFLKEKAANVILQTDKELVSIMQKSFPYIRVIKKSESPSEYDILAQFMDIELMLRKDFSDIPYSNGYLKADEELIKMFSNLDEFKTDKKKIGLFWQGNRNIFKNRAVPFDIIKKLADNKKCRFYSFQLGENIEETDNLIDLSKYIKDYADTAALLKNIDILISIDSSIAHMAGALGVKTFLMLPKTAEWRWFNDEDKTPWYDSIKIFKQTVSADWEDAAARINQALNNL